MNAGQFYMPTQIFWGRGIVQEKAELFKALGKTALIVTGKHSAKMNGSLDDVEAVLQKNGQASVLFDRVMSNPTIDCVYEGAALAREKKIDFIIAIGGGSPMDAAKAINFLTTHDVKRADLFTTPPVHPLLPLVAVPTTAGTGSEVTQYSVLMNDALKTKSSLGYPELFPTCALLDGRYMMSLKPATTVNTALDALSHLAESYLAGRANLMSRAVALKGLALLAPYFKRLNASDFTEEDRDNLLMASTYGGLAIAVTSTTAVHTMGYPLTYFKNIDHGRANALLLPEYLSWLEKKAPQEVAEVLKALEVPGTAAFAEKTAELLGARETLTADEIAAFTASSMANAKIHSGIADMTEADVRGIYTAAMAR